MSIETSIALIAFAFIVLVIYLAWTLFTLSKTLNQATKTLEKVNLLTQDIEHKAQALDSLFQAVSLIGDKLREKTEDLTRNEVSETKTQSPDKVTDILEWVAGGIRLWTAFKKRR